MNYYNPYFSTIPYTSAPMRNGILSSLLGGKTLSFTSILSGVQKTIGFANQAIPLARQISPTIKNAKTMFKVMNEFKRVEPNNKVNSSFKTSSTSKNNSNVENIINNEKFISDGPTFFI
ncbi:MAG: VrrA/YqfQ family protein [Bacilli bacterium]